MTSILSQRWSFQYICGALNGILLYNNVKHMKVSKKYTTVTPLSKTLALILFIALPFIGFRLGMQYQHGLDVAMQDPNFSPSVISDVTFSCADNKKIRALFYAKHVELSLSDGRNLALPQVISGSGARYANTDESIVFWNKGTTAFLTEGTATTFNNCNEMSK